MKHILLFLIFFLITHTGNSGKFPEQVTYYICDSYYYEKLVDKDKVITVFSVRLNTVEFYDYHEYKYVTYVRNPSMLYGYNGNFAKKDSCSIVYSVHNTKIFIYKNCNGVDANIELKIDRVITKHE